MRITQHNKVIRLAKKTAEDFNANQFLIRDALEKAIEAKSADEKIYALELLINSIKKVD